MRSSLLEAMHAHPESRIQIIADDLTARFQHVQGSPLDLKAQKAAVEHVMPANLGAWGTLHILDRLEAHGDHQFDLLYQQISIRFEPLGNSAPGTSEAFRCNRCAARAAERSTLFLRVGHVIVVCHRRHDFQRCDHARWRSAAA